MHKITSRILLISNLFLFFIFINFIPMGLLYPSLNKLKGKITINYGQSKLLFTQKLTLFIPDQSLSYFFSSTYLKKIYPGDYIISFDKNIFDNLKIFQHRQRFKITFYEGITRQEIMELLEKYNLCDKNTFIHTEQKILSNQQLRKKYFISHYAKNLEGYLYPDTYYFYSFEAPLDIISKMLNRFKEIIYQLDTHLDRNSFYQKLIIASLIQKEAGRNEEKLVSSVIYNRLKLRMKLQIDATILYSLSLNNIEDNNITKRNKYFSSPYNTYVHYGLPPGPICNPGKIALDAALHPANTKFLYYVSTNKGYHIFSKTYKNHLENVKRFQQSNY